MEKGEERRGKGKTLVSFIQRGGVPLPPSTFTFHMLP